MTDESLSLPRVISDICTYIPTKSQYKGHGYLEWYEDDKVRLVLDTYVPNMGVEVMGKVGWIGVFGKAYHSRPHRYRPGKWEDYLRETLWPLAEAKRLEVKAEIDRRGREEQRQRYAPVDDAATFV